MQINIDEGGDDIVSVRESYRLAKRNVLFWGAVTTLIALGTAATQKPVQVESVVQGLSIPPTMLTALSLAVLAFMAFGYHRADRVLVSDNSQFARARHMKENAAAVQRLGEEIATAQGDAAALHEAILDIGVNIAKEIDSTSADLKAYDVEAGWHDNVAEGRFHTFEEAAGLRSLPRPSAMDPNEASKFTIETMRKVAAVAMRWAANETDRSVERLDRARSGFAWHSERAKALLEERKSTIETAGTEFLALRSDLEKFADTIDRGDKAYFYLHDRGVVIAVTTVAFFVGICRLVAPQTLAATVDYWF